jgi:integrase/recombinase XerC
VRILAERATHLTRHLRSTAQPPVLCTGAGGSDAHKQARVCVTVREILTRAGLSDDIGVKPTSLTGYAARQEFARTGHIEAAARLIGSTSLDTTSSLIGYHWQRGD